MEFDTYQPDTKSNPNRNSNTATKQHAIVNIQLSVAQKSEPLSRIITKSY